MGTGFSLKSLSETHTPEHYHEDDGTWHEMGQFNSSREEDRPSDEVYIRTAIYECMACKTTVRILSTIQLEPA